MKTTQQSADVAFESGRMRLNKALAQAGVCSRRSADELIRSGRVTVNGQAPEGMGQSVDPRADDIRLDGKPIASPAQDASPVSIALHKPVGVVTTAKDPEGRQTVMDLVRHRHPGQRLFPVGRLDFFSEGLIVLTTDGELANRMMHPRWHLPKRYRLTVRGVPSEADLAAMRRGMTLAEGEKLAPVKVNVLERQDSGSTVLEMELTQGVNRQIRRMCRDLGLTVLKLVRTSQGPVFLGDLRSGESRPLYEAELKALRAAVGLA